MKFVRQLITQLLTAVMMVSGKDMALLQLAELDGEASGQFL